MFFFFTVRGWGVPPNLFPARNLIFLQPLTPCQISKPSHNPFLLEKPLKKLTLQEGRGTPIFFAPILILFCDYSLCAKFQNRSINPSGRKVYGTKRKKNNHKKSGRFVLQPRQRAAHSLRSDQKFVSY